MPGFLKAASKGTFGLNSSISYLILKAMSCIGINPLSLKNLITPMRDLEVSSTNFSAVTASMVLKSSCIQL